MFAASVCENFGMPLASSPAWVSNQSTSLLLGWKPEMRMSVPVKETVFLMQLRKETARDSRSGWEWGKG